MKENSDSSLIMSLVSNWNMYKCCPLSADLDIFLYYSLRQDGPSLSHHKDVILSLPEFFMMHFSLFLIILYLFYIVICYFVIVMYLL